MAEPEHSHMHNYAYSPSVANWVHSTTLATQFEGPSHDPPEPSPDEYYKSPFSQAEHAPAPAPPADDMTTTRQRQQAPNGAVRPQPRPAFRSASGPASSTTSTTRATPQLPGNRPTVKSLAQKFNHPSSTESSPSSARIRPVRPASAKPSTASSSPARPAKEASYGPHKFNNLKPRERPQPAPASPASMRRVNGRRPSTENQVSPSRRKASSPTKNPTLPATPSRQPFFGEVVGEHDTSTPGFGIPVLETAATASEPGTSPAVEKSTVKLVTDDPHLSPEPLFTGQSPVRHRRSPSEMTSQSADHSQPAPHMESPHSREPRRRSPPSRIPIASRRLSAASDSGSSNRSFKGGAARPSTAQKRTSPNRSHRSPATQRSLPIIQSKTPPSTLPSSRYRGKSPKAGGTGHSLTAVITSPPQPKSPRLRNSRERQLLSHESTDINPRAPEPHDGLDLNGDVGLNVAPKPGIGQSLDQADSTHPKNAPAAQREGIRIVHDSDNSVDMGTSSVQPAQETAALSLQTSNLHAPQVPAPLSATTDFEYEESPILGMPGSFMLTPPMPQDPAPMASGHHSAHASPELLQPNTFQPLSKGPVAGLVTSEDPENLPSELGIRESIPIMLGTDKPASGPSPTSGRSLHSPRLSIGAHKWRAEPLDATGTISFLEEDDSPTDPFANRDTLLPDDSASNVFYRHTRPEWTPKMPSLPSIPDAKGLTLDSEAYSVINKVLNLYHRSPEISPEVAYDSRNKIQQVSPIVAQHNDWCSKESTETYLARLLSDANAAGEQSRENGYAVPEEQTHRDAGNSVPDLSIQSLDDDLGEAHAGGTAIIFPSESRRYSRASSATTIQDDASRADSSSGMQAREHSPDKPMSHQGHFHTLSRTSYTQSQERPLSSSRGSLYAQGDMVSGAAYNLLPEIATAGEGLGLSLQASNQSQQSRQDQPPARPAPLPPTPADSDAPIPMLPSSKFQPPTRRSALVRRSREPSQDKILFPRPKIEIPKVSDVSIPLDAHDQVQSEVSIPTHPMEGVDPTQPGSNIDDDLQLTPTKTVKVVDSASSSTIAASEKYEHGVYPPLPTREDGAESKEIHPCALPDEDPEASAKRLQRRYRVLEEIAHTEHMFSSDMMVVSEIWLGTASEAFPDARDREKVFANVAEISKFSYTLWQDLKGNIAPIVNQMEPPKPGEENPDDPYNEFENCTLDNDWDVAVGFVFKAYLPKIERLYTKYISNHDNANKIISARVLEKDQAYLGWQLACYNHSKDITDAWDLDSLLVKPVQRLLKYPLLLDSLIAVTAPTHHDYDDLVYARKEIMEISNRINDNKKRQEAIREATKEGKREKKKGFRGIDIVKAFTGKTDKVKQQAGLADQWSDKEYDKQSQKFGGHFFQIQIILSDVDNYRDELTQCFLHLNILALSMVTLLESAPSSSPEIESAWRRNAMALLELRNVLLEDHKKAVRVRVWQPLHDLWSMYVKPETLMSKRKKLLPQYTRYHQALERKEKIDPKLEEAAQSFLAVNNALKEELPRMYDLTKKAVNAILKSFVRYQMDWWKNCQKKILPLLEYEPEHTTSFAYDMKAYVDRFHSDAQSVNAAMARLAICNGNLMNDIANFSSPLPSLYPDDTSSRKSSSRRTESIGSDISTFEGPRHRRSGGYPGPQRTMPSFEGPPGARPSMPSFEGPPRSAPHGYVQIPPKSGPSSAPLMPRPYTGPVELPALRDDRAISPASDKSDITVTQDRGGRTRSYSSAHYQNMDGAFDEYDPPALASAYLSPTQSNPSSSRGSAIFTSALPMSDSPVASRSAEELPGTPNDPDEPEVLFLAASLFEFNIAHDRREGGIPYLVYVPGEIFDVIGMKGELWLARNQDDPSKTVGWIWEKHFARILPEEM